MYCRPYRMRENHIFKQFDKAVPAHCRRDFAGRRAGRFKETQYCLYFSGVFHHALADSRRKLGFGLKIKGVEKEKAKKLVDEYLDIVGLTKYRRYYPDQLSASMLQRVVIARAFATQPDLLLMDEPYGQLDIQLRYHLEDELISLWQRTKTTVLFITHNIEEAVYMGERILVLTNKPTSIKCAIDNELPRPRDIASPDFVKLRNEVTDLIKWW